MKVPAGQKIIFGGFKFYPGDEIPDEIAKKMNISNHEKPAPPAPAGKK
jgi:hypothetical protein